MTQRNATQHKDKLITVTHNEMYESLSHHIYLKKKKTKYTRNDYIYVVDGDTNQESGSSAGGLRRPNRVLKW